MPSAGGFRSRESSRSIASRIRSRGSDVAGAELLHAQQRQRALLSHSELVIEQPVDQRLSGARDRAALKHARNATPDDHADRWIEQRIRQKPDDALAGTTQREERFPRQLVPFEQRKDMRGKLA